jgi:predicted MPP superfamily phosphohydrolase
VFGLPVVLVVLLFCLADWALLWALPRLQLSFSSEISSALIADLVVRLVLFGGLVGATLLARRHKHDGAERTQAQPAVVLFLALNLGLSFLQLDVYVVEPLLVETTELSLTSADLDLATPPVRVIHLTDMHIERTSFRENTVVQRVNALRPDIVVLTGDYLNVSYTSDPVAANHFREFVAQLEAPYGVYAVRGSVEPTPESMAQLVQDTDIIWLEQEAVTVNVRGQSVTLVGVACSHEHELDVARLDRTMEGVPADTFTLLLYHSPDLIREAAGRGIDLHLGGHTHGGQIRLPFYGAIVTFSRYGKQYEAGLFQEGDTTMYISRGLGFEGGRAPRARFLCRPEVVSVDLVGERE